MKLSGSMTMKYSIHMLKYIIHMYTMCDYEVLPPAGTAMRKRDFEDLPPAGTNSRTCASVRKASPSSGSFTVTGLLCCRRERESFQGTIEKLNCTDSGYDTEFSFGSILAEFSKVVDLGEPTSFLDHVYLRCTQRQCEISKDIVDNYRTMFESRISAGGTEKLLCSEILCISSWSYDMEEHAKNCVERYCELANRTTQQLYKVSTPCIDDHHFKEEELKSVGELSKVCSQIVLKCLYLARIGRPDILWSVNKLARSITKRTKACDKRLSRLISYIHHTCDYKQYCHVRNTDKQCRLGLSQDFDFAGDHEDSKSTSGGTLCTFGSHTFVSISWMCKKQTSVSHSSTESEIISLDAELRLDGITALDVWDLIVTVLHGNTYQSNQVRGDPSKFPTRQKIHGKIDDLDNVNFISSNVNSSRKEALLLSLKTTKQ